MLPHTQTHAQLDADTQYAASPSVTLPVSPSLPLFLSLFLEAFSIRSRERKTLIE